MKFVKPSFQILTELNEEQILRNIEIAGRTCYKSEDKITGESARAFVEMIIKRGHLTVIEHEKITIRFVCDRGVSHELVRHRICSFSQESTRYCNYTKMKFGNDLTFIQPCFWMDLPESNDVEKHAVLEETLLHLEMAYKSLIDLGASPQEARYILPNGLKTEIVVTANLRQWRLILQQRAVKAAHPQMREIMIPLLRELQHQLPSLFNDIIIYE